MCGIAGVISPDALTEAEIGLVRRMTGAMFHRGPDSDGFFVDSHVAFGMRRLSIIDLASGQQPLFNEDESLTLICNGEIYNHRALRGALSTAGHRFRSMSDVETIIHAYEERELACLPDLRGMFAFALWDTRKRRLVLARDRMGEKPLFLHRDARGRLWFASELRALRVAIEPSRLKLSPRAINLFLTFQYVPEPETLLEGVHLLPAGHVLTLSPERTDAASEPYWDFFAIPPADGDPVETARVTFDEACGLMGTADVPVGVALSGGIDSSLVAAITARRFPGQVKAFTIGYPNRPDTDERAIAERFAAKCGIPFSSVEISADELTEGFPRLVWDMDVPIADIAAYGYYAVARTARMEGVPVLLSGLGGDEMFWGYDWVRAAVARNNVIGQARPAWWKRLLGMQRVRAERTFYEVHDELRNSDIWSREIMGSAGAALPPGLWTQTAELSAEPRVDMAVSELLNRTWLRSNCLALADRVSMAHSVEMRLPFLDPVLIERISGFRAGGLADWRKPHKWLILSAFGDILPDEIVRRKKQGFTPPTHQWMSRITTRYRSLLKGGGLARLDLIDTDRLQAALSRISPTFLYKLVLLELWTRTVILGEDTELLTATTAENGRLAVRHCA